MNPIKSRADMPANQPYNKTPCQSAYRTNPALTPYCYLPLQATNTTLTKSIYCLLLLPVLQQL